MKDSQPQKTSSHPAKTSKTVILSVLLVYVLTVATNLGEFWPFSIYPMFSQAGRTWNRSLVREMPAGERVTWAASSLENLPGAPFSVRSNGVDPIDLANFVSKTLVWDSLRVAALEKMMFGGRTPDKSLMIFKVQGRLADRVGVEVTATPWVLISPGKDQVNPSIVP
ncbi:MAG: hypothetical protein O3B41_01760 [Bacteroidetes bacterium]|nr:hypothetical protein [Bacteroidota bacterium]